MSGAKVRVAVNGYGVIGERVADAVALQGDLQLVGVVAVASDYRVRVAVERGTCGVRFDAAARHEMDVAGIQVAGTVDDLLGVWHGGEKQQLTGYSFRAQVNHPGALNRGFARVVSCNTTCDAHVAASPVTTICDGPHVRSRPALRTGGMASC